jgi:hypothetical protein
MIAIEVTPHFLNAVKHYVHSHAYSHIYVSAAAYMLCSKEHV